MILGCDPGLQTQTKACRVCRNCFEPRNSMQSVCSPRCAVKLATSLQKLRKAEKSVQAKVDRAKREALKTIPDLIREAQVAFNAYIRARDAGKPCICCGRPLDDSGGVRGSGYDAGHYRSTGSAPHLRFNENNVHAQRKQCNRFGAGRAVDYRIGLIQRIGAAAVEALESDNRVHKWTREELVQIRATYVRKLKEQRTEA